jgi:transcriptional regulator with XRE-family HTH domain
MVSRRHGGLRAVLGANVRRLRKVKGLSQEAFGDDCSLHRTQVGAVERAEANLTMAKLELVAAALAVEAAYLLTPHKAAD